MLKRKVYDIETLKEMFCYVDYDIETKEINKFYIHKNRNNWDDLVKYLNNIEKEKYQLIGFNNLSFDSQVIQYINDNQKELTKDSTDTKLTKIYKISQECIRRGNEKERSLYLPWQITIPQIDLFKIWHFDNQAKWTSLKWVEFSINFPNTQEMPIAHDSSVEECDIDVILDYCVNDVLATHEFYKYTIGETEHPLYKGINKLELRENLSKEFNVDFTNYNDVKIGDKIQKLTYSRLKGISEKEVPQKGTFRKEIKLKKCIPSFVKFNSKEFNELVDRIKKITINNTKGDFEETIIYKNVAFNVRTGGLHSQETSRIVIPTEDEILEDRDCTSQYPKSIINLGLFPAHLGPEWLEGYKWIYNERVKAKGKKDYKSVAINEAYKLALNGGGYGKTGEVNSWQYDPMVTMTVTISNQLALLMLAERYLDNNIEVLSANTDGLLIKYKKDQYDLVKQIDKQWELETSHNLEYTQYKKLIQTNVNTYLAEKTNGELKHKGTFFTVNHEIHKNKSFRITAIALQEYFINNIPIEETIKNHQNIYDFCSGKKSKGGWYYETVEIKDQQQITEKQQKVVRYYISNNGKKLMKYNKDGRSTQVDAGKWKSTIFNKFEQKDIKNYDINYDFYINKTREIIELIQPRVNQLQLF